MPTTQLYLGDCLDVMRGMDANSVDTILTDPPYGLEFMGRDWDHGIPGEAYWAEALRVARPGALLLAFGGTRTWHRLAVAIEDAGWELRDTLMWLYGGGFPKSLDLSKAIDKAAKAEREVLATLPAGSGPLKNGHVHKGGGGGLSVGTERSPELKITAPATPLAAEWQGWGTALKPAWEPIIVAQKPIDGTYAHNAEHWGVAGFWIDGGRIGTDEHTYTGSKTQFKHSGTGEYQPQYGERYGGHPVTVTGRWPANLILDEDAAAEMGEVSRYFQVCKAERICSLCDLPTNEQHGITNATQAEVIPCEHVSSAVSNLSHGGNCSGSVAESVQPEPRHAVVGKLALSPSPADSAASSSPTMQETSESSAHNNARLTAIEKNVRTAWSAVNLCDSCVTAIAQSIVAMQHEQDPALLPCLGFIGAHKRQILIHSLALFVESQPSTDTIPTIVGLSLLLGYVQSAMQNSTPTNAMGDEHVLTRYKYQSKASRAERNAGLEGIDLDWLDSTELIDYDGIIYRLSEVMLWERQGQSPSTVLNGEAPQERATSEDTTPERADSDFSTSWYGKPITAQSLTGIRFTTSTGTRLTIDSQTLNSLHLSNTSGCTVAATETLRAYGLSPAESVACISLWRLITTSARMAYLPGAKSAPRQTPPLTSVSDVLKQRLRTNIHSTVKPLALMRYLARLTKTPTGGVVLDPFMGSGTTGMACALEGREFIGIEKEAEYLEIAKRRIAWAEAQGEPATAPEPIISILSPEQSEPAPQEYIIQQTSLF